MNTHEARSLESVHPTDRAPRGRWAGRVVVVATIVGIGIASGCGSLTVTTTPRSGTEQLLLTDAWDAALQRVDFRPLVGPPVFLETENLKALDQGWVVYRLRQAMMRQGVRLVDKKDQAQVVVEAALGAYGTDVYDWMLGIPRTTVAAGMFGVPMTALPELALAKKTKQTGVTKLSLFAHDRLYGQYVWESGTIEADSFVKNAYVGSIGPIRSGTIDRETGARRRGLLGRERRVVVTYP